MRIRLCPNIRKAAGVRNLIVTRGIVALGKTPIPATDPFLQEWLDNVEAFLTNSRTASDSETNSGSITPTG